MNQTWTENAFTEVLSEKKKGEKACHSMIAYPSSPVSESYVTSAEEQEEEEETCHSRFDIDQIRSKTS